ncbi:MAG: hypothetical protein HYZ69_01410 [Candidatus Colwellbacteria bacterium]|nr:hypothetical protein [Candidatus Colwellbacteria bacterium]
MPLTYIPFSDKKGTERRCTLNIDNTEVFVGAPIFGNAPWLSFIAPIGQRKLYEQVRGETQEPKEITLRLGEEYGAILISLRAMGVRFKIAFAYPEMMLPQIRGFLEAEGFEFISFPKLGTQLIAFPRDLAIRLPNNIILMNSDLSGYRLRRRLDKKVLFSPYGEGGRLLARKNMALVAEKIYPDGRVDKAVPAQPEPLLEAGLKVGLIPNPVTFGRERGLSGLVPGDHLDSTCGLLEDADGKLHLIVDPEIYSGWRGPYSTPEGPGITLTRYLHVCEELGIKLHIPKRLSVPASVSFVQFKSKQVLMTGGDEEVSGIVASIVGEENVFMTPIPVRYYPAWSKAGIRCLIGEFPYSIPRVL